MSVTVVSSQTSASRKPSGMRQISQSLAIRPGLASGRPLTDARLDGVGAPTIEPSGERTPALPTHDESPLPTAALVREAADTALDSLDALESQARDVARRFKRLAIDEAQAGLAGLVQSMQTLLKLAAMAATATGTDIETLCRDHDLDIEADMHSALAKLIGRQLERDWHGLARVIDHSLVPVLDVWRAVFLALGGTTHHGHAA